MATSEHHGIQFFTCTYKVNGEKCSMIVATLPNGDRYRKGFWGEGDYSALEMQWKYNVISNREFL